MSLTTASDINAGVVVVVFAVTFTAIILATVSIVVFNTVSCFIAGLKLLL